MRTRFPNVLAILVAVVLMSANLALSLFSSTLSCFPATLLLLGPCLHLLRGAQKAHGYWCCPSKSISKACGLCSAECRRR